jgi:6-phosphogluconolactonase
MNCSGDPEGHTSIQRAEKTADTGKPFTMRLPSLLLCFVAAVVGASGATIQSTPQPILFAATWTKETTNGINTFKLDAADGSLTPYGITPLSFAAKGLNPTYVQGSTKKFSNDEQVIYALNRGSTTGYVSAMTLQSNGTLKVINTQEMKGGSPAHISLSPKEDFLSVANYAGSLSLFPLKADGSLEAESFYQDFPVGSKVVMDNQATGHVHSTTWLPNSSHVIAANLGGDELLQYELDVTKKTLKSLETVTRPPGSGPRHMALHPDGGFAYVTDELSNTVGVYTIDKTAALLSSSAVQNITTLPPGFTNTSTAADIHLSSNGKFVYVSNRGHNSIVSYKINADGTLKPLDWESSRGLTPRGFTIYKDWLIVANQGSDDMYVFKMDGETGALTYTGNSYKIDGAVSLYVAEY